jgi:hypothetical protein
MHTVYTESLQRFNVLGISETGSVSAAFRCPTSVAAITLFYTIRTAGINVEALTNLVLSITVYA